jgi:hypothetical protein
MNQELQTESGISLKIKKLLNTSYLTDSNIMITLKLESRQNVCFNPIPTGHGRNQPIYECHVTKAGRNRLTGELG